MFEGLFQPVHLLIWLVFGVIALLPGIFYLLTLQKALARCSPESRTTSPESVWLLLIPFFALVYNFIIVNHIAKSLSNEFARRGIPVEDRRPGKTIGMAMCILAVAGLIPHIGIVISIVGLIAWIFYWREIAEYSRRIALPALPSQEQPILPQ